MEPADPPATPPRSEDDEPVYRWLAGAAGLAFAFGAAYTTVQTLTTTAWPSNGMDTPAGAWWAVLIMAAAAAKALSHWWKGDQWMHEHLARLFARRG